VRAIGLGLSAQVTVAILQKLQEKEQLELKNQLAVIFQYGEGRLIQNTSIASSELGVPLKISD